MATIGTFTSTENGFTGSIRTLALNVKARIARVENPSDKGPQFRVYAGSVELGSGLIAHSQKITVAARAMAERKAIGHRS